MGRRRWRPYVLGAIILLVAVGMCAWIIRSAAPEAIANMGTTFQQQAEIDRAADTIRALPGVETITARRVDAVVDGKKSSRHSAMVRVRVNVASGTPTKQLAAIGAAIRTAWTNEKLAGTHGDGVITLANKSTITITTAPKAAQLAAEFTYWDAAQKALGIPLALSIAPGTDGAAYVRTLAPLSATPASTTTFLARFAKLQALPETTSGRALWVFPGFSIVGKLPPASLVRLTSNLETIQPLVPPTPIVNGRGFSVSWADLGTGSPRAAITFFDRDSHALNDSRNWGAMVDTTSAILSAKLPGVAITYEASRSGGQLVLGGCKDTISTADQDETFLTTLRASGAPLPHTAQAGHCVDASTTPSK